MSTNVIWQTEKECTLVRTFQPILLGNYFCRDIFLW